MFDVKEINAETGEEVVRPASPAEIAQAELDAENARLEAETKAAAVAKLAALGLTTDDLEALGLA